MLKQRILTIIVALSVIIAGYFIFTTGAEQFIDYQKYQTTKNELFSQSSYVSRLDEVEIEVLLRVENSEFKINTIIAEPKVVMRNLKLLVISNSSEAKNSQDFYPSLGLIDQQVINLIPNATNNQTDKSGIVLSYVSRTNVSEVLVYLSFTNQSNQTQTYYLKLTPKI
jgi:hypothetical protein